MTNELTQDQLDDIVPWTGDQLKTQAEAPSTIVTADQSRAIAEAQAAMVVARMNPRDEDASLARILKACKRKSLAEQALYSYKRGDTLIEDVSIRLAEEIGRSWGNMTWGFRELGRRGMFAEVEAFAWDLENNCRTVRQYQQRLSRDKAGGKTQDLKHERDKYELMASFAQRRVRACILQLVPGDVVDAAKNAVKETLTQDNRELESRIKRMQQAFGKIGVTAKALEKRLRHALKSCTPEELTELQGIYQAIKDNVASKDEYFDKAEVTPIKEPDDNFDWNKLIGCPEDEAMVAISKCKGCDARKENGCTAYDEAIGDVH